MLLFQVKGLNTLTQRMATLKDGRQRVVTALEYFIGECRTVKENLYV
jgi:hypothetical protein